MQLDTQTMTQAWVERHLMHSSATPPQFTFGIEQSPDTPQNFFKILASNIIHKYAAIIQ